ncbi:MAG TPA: ABC transporter ATP-binding protein [candidate division Zixibacteria bacterium]|jgi:ABC-type multidrug transport system ATPase subunit
MGTGPVTNYNLEVENLSKSYGRRVICHDINLTAAPGELVAVVGPNGSGKSTFLRIIAGLTRPDSGSVSHRYAGQVLSSNRLHKSVGMVSADLALYDELTALENLRLAARLSRMHQDYKQLGDALAEFGLAGRGDERVATYSSGMKQRLKLCVALLKRPSLLLLDEPTTGLDPEGVELVWRQALASGAAILFATNDVAEARRASRRVRMGPVGGWETDD